MFYMYIHIYSNNIEAKGAKAIVENLIKNQTITTMDICNYHYI
jgi:hypothetical protein